MKSALYSHYTALCRVWIVLIALSVIVVTVWTNISLWILIASYLLIGLLPPALLSLLVKKEHQSALFALNEGNPEPLYRFTSLFKKQNLSIAINHSLSLYELGKREEAEENLLRAEPKHFKSKGQALIYYHNLCLFTSDSEKKRYIFEKEKIAASFLTDPAILPYKDRLLNTAEAHVLYAEGSYDRSLALTEMFLNQYPHSFDFMLLKAKCMLALDRDKEEAKKIITYILFKVPCMAPGREAEQILQSISF